MTRQLQPPAYPADRRRCDDEPEAQSAERAPSSTAALTAVPTGPATAGRTGAPSGLRAAGGVQALAPGTRLIHIGPHKTGTTSVQSALHNARLPMAEHGVRYAGRQRHSLEAAVAVTGAGNLLGGKEPLGHYWDELVAEVQQASEDRVVISSEFLSEADDAAMTRILKELGAERPHVLVTLRPLARILSSQWQQYVQNGLRTSYANWLEGMLEQAPYTKPTPSFWRRHAHADLVQRWADAVGADHLTVIVVDDRDRRMLMDTCESLLGLPHGLLQPLDHLANRSLTAAEIELVRRLNVTFREQQWPEAVYSRFIRYGSVLALQKRIPEPDEARILTPDWALDRAAEIGRRDAERIWAMGVQVIGDPATLGSRPAASGEMEVAATVPTDVAVTAALGAIRASGAVDERERPLERRQVSDVTVPDLAKVVVRRVRRRYRRMIRR